ncbi:DUF4174 domain-containing protein [uncultured Roseobacter sp.]|uniref:DUF4174 domain-containing protein n=1 Tax=uncultured Roseobacter sp. TaxID=114847 RepID=UPI002629A02E|nr:DUF4174 domain-containing protein [uncultured Roseobacter sp.]
MKTLLPLVLTGIFALTQPAVANGESEENPLFFSMDEVNLNQFKWKNRPVVVFAETENDPAFIEQMDLLRARESALRERDVVVITDTDPAARSDIRIKLRPRGFMLAIIGKDGGVKLRKPFPWDVREISRSIDKMPMRQREIRAHKEDIR